MTTSKKIIKKKRSQQFHQIREKQPYYIEMLGIKLIISEDVFPSDYGATTRYLAQEINKYCHVNTALDMGCGCGFLALYMRKCGIYNVWAADIHPPAIECAKLNLGMNQFLAPIKIIESDLFCSFPKKVKFDLIVFNHPYYPTIGDPVFGFNPDGGRLMLERFYSKVPDYCKINTKILMPFSSISESEHDPKQVATKYNNIAIKTIFKIQNEDGFHRIYELTTRS